MAVWSEVALSKVSAASRFDAEYFQPDYMARIKRLDRLKPDRVGDFAFVTDGIHASPDVVEVGGVRYLSAKCVKDNDFAIGDTLLISAAQHSANRRTQIKRDDVLVTTVGTIGNAAVVHDDILPANTDRHLGIIRINADANIDPYYLATFFNSTFGRFQTLRESTGNVQLNLFIEKIKTLRVVRVAEHDAIAKKTRDAYARRKEAEKRYAEAEALLESALGLDKLDLTPRLFYERPYADVQNAGRFDAEYFQPRMQNLIAALSRDGQTISDVAKLSKRYFKAEAGVEFQYIEIGDVSASGTAGSNPVAGEEAPSRATWIVEPGDIVTTMVRPIRRLSAIITDEQAGYICSSGFAVLTPKDIAPELLLVYLRLPLVCELLDLQTTASMYPAIAPTALMKIPVALPKDSMRQKIVMKVRESIAARREAHRLLDVAKAMVEDAIVGK